MTGILSQVTKTKQRWLYIPGLPGLLACVEHSPLAGVGDDFADCAAGAAELGDHAAAYDPPKATESEKHY